MRATWINLTPQPGRKYRGTPNILACSKHMEEMGPRFLGPWWGYQGTEPCQFCPAKKEKRPPKKENKRD